MFKIRRKYIDPDRNSPFILDIKKFMAFQYRGGTDSITY